MSKPSPEASAIVRNSTLEKVTKSGKRPNPVADDLSYGQHRHGEDGPGNTPHPEPEDERENDENGIESEPSCQKHRRYRLSLDQMNCQIERRGEKRLPEVVYCQQAGEEKDHNAQRRTEDRRIVEQE